MGEFTTIGINSDLRDELKIMCVHQKKEYEQLVKDLVFVWNKVIDFEKSSDFKKFVMKEVAKKSDIVVEDLEDNYFLIKTDKELLRAYVSILPTNLPQDCDEYYLNFVPSQLKEKGKINGKPITEIKN